MLSEGTIEMTAEEQAALEALVEKHGALEGVTRRDPGEAGPIIATVDGNEYEVTNG